MKTLIKIVLFSLLGFIVLGYLFLNVYLDREKIDELVIQPMEEATGYTIKLEDYSFGVWGGLHLSLEKGNVKDPNLTRYSELVSFEEIKVFISTDFIFSGQLNIEECSVIKPVIHYEIPVSSETQTEKSIETQTDSIGSTKAPDLSLVLGAFNIVSGELHIFEPSANIELNVKNLNNQVSLSIEQGILNTVGELTVENLSVLQLDSNQTLVSDNNLVLGYNLSGHLESQQFEIKDVSYNVFGLNGNVTGSIHSKENKHQLKINAAPVAISELLKRFPLPQINELPEIKGEILYAATVSVDGEKTDYKADITLNKISLTDPVTKLSLDELSAKIEARPEKIIMKSLTAKALSQQFDFNGEIDPNSGKLFIKGTSAHAFKPLMALKQYIPEGLNIESGIGKGTYKVAGNINNLENIDIRSAINLSNIKLKQDKTPVQIKHLNLSAKTTQTQEVNAHIDLDAEGQKLAILALYHVKKQTIKSSGSLTTDLKKLQAFNFLFPDGFKLKDGSLIGSYTVQGNLKNLKNMNYNVDVKAKNIAFNSSALKEQFKAINVHLTADPKTVKLVNLSAQAEHNDFNGTMTFTDYMNLINNDLSKSRLTGTFYSNQLNLNHLLDLAEKEETKKPVQTPKENPLKNLAILAKLDLDLKTDIKFFQFKTIKINNIQTQLFNGKNQLKLNKASLDIFSGNVSGTAQINYNNPRNIWVNTTLSTKNVESNDALTALLDFKNHIYGKLNMSGNIALNLDDTAGIIQPSIIGKLDLHVTNGKLVNIPALKKLGSTINFLNFEEVYMNSWKNGLVIKNETVHFNNTQINTKDYDLYANNAFIKFDKQMSFPLTVEFSKAISDHYTKVSGNQKIAGIPVKPILKYLKNKQGRIVLKPIIKGQVDHPAFTLDLKDAMDKAKEDAAKKLVKGLKGLFN